MIEKGPWMVISDLQTPFEHKRALSFCQYIKRHYKINNESVLCIGDETDQYWGGMWRKDINAGLTALGEITATKEKLAPWYDAFPKMRICISNHGTRWQRLALESSIPAILMRRYEEVLGCPPGWRWQKRWLIRARQPFLIEHGDRFGGAYPHAQAASINALSTVIGHFHSIAGVEHIQTRGSLDNCEDEAGFKVWGMCVGSLIDFERFAFHYAREAKRKPKLGVGVILDQGRLPIWVPME